MGELRIGLVFELLGSLPPGSGPPDADAEFEPEATIAALERGLGAAGCTPVRLGGPRDLLRAGAALPRVDAVLNIAEGYGSRNREAWAPVLLELLRVPALGSDALTLSLTLDKLWTHRHLEAAGLPVPAHASYASVEDLEKRDVPAPYPLFVKPRWEGTAKGIRSSSRVEDALALRAEVARVTADYDQPALVEAFLPGPEYTVGVVGHDPPRALPVLQRALEAETGIGLHALENELGASARSVLPGDLVPALEANLHALALRAHAALDCLDFSRIDFRLDAHGRPHLLEVNPLPTFAPDGTFAILAELEGLPFEDFLARILTAALERMGLR